MCNLKSYGTKDNVYVKNNTNKLLIAIILETINRHLKYPNRNSPIYRIFHVNNPILFLLYCSPFKQNEDVFVFCDSCLSEEGIDEESFLLLDEAIIKDLIPRAGPRLKFMKHFRGLVSC